MAEVKGLQELQRTINRLSDGVNIKGAGPLNSALRKGANVVRDAAKARTATFGPGKHDNRTRDYGRLTDSISSRKDPDPQSNNFTHRYSVSYGDAFWGRFLELGSEIFEKRNFPKSPWLRPSFDENRGKMLAAVSTELGRQIKKLAKQVRR